MSGLVATVASAAGLFMGTNLDDLVVLAMLFSAGRVAGAPSARQVWAGQAAGFALLVGAAVLTALGLAVIPARWVGLLGLLPLSMGVLGLVKAARTLRTYGPSPSVVPATGVLSVMALTLVNGADNLAVYTPVFRTIGSGAAVVTGCVFAVGVAVWCWFGSRLGSHERVVGVIRRWGHWIVPGIFVAIGLAILLGSGTLAVDAPR